MGAKLPIAAKLLAGQPIGYMSSCLEQVNRAVRLKGPEEQVVSVRGAEPEIREAVMEGLRAAVPFDVQVASDLYWGNKKDYYRIDRDFGPMLLPYPAVWMEWEVPKDHYIAGKLIRNPEAPVMVAAYIYQDDGPQFNMPRRVVYTLTFQFVVYTSGFDAPQHLDRPLLFNEVALKVGLNADGTFCDGALLELHPEHLSLFSREQLDVEAKTSMFVAAMALNLINCKNVTTAPAGVVQQRRTGTQKRRGVQPIRYHTIVLPGMTVERRSATRKQQRANHDQMGHHMVRGHFKSFTKDAPLLGKHTGTYWWGWQTRGSKAKGEVKADYQIGDTA